MVHVSDFDIMKALGEYSHTKVPGAPDQTPTERLCSSIENRGFDMTYLGPVLETRGSQQILSCAGSGKTTTLIFKILYDIASGEITSTTEFNGQVVRTVDKVWVSTFLRSGAEELKSSLWKWQTRMSLPDYTSSVKFSTLHAEFKSVLNSLGVETNFVDAKKNSSYLKTILRGLKINNGALNNEIVREFEGALTYTRNRLDRDRYTHPTYEAYRVFPNDVDKILQDWSKTRRVFKEMDFEDLQDYLYEFLYIQKNQTVIDAIENRYSYMYIDEFQDTSQIQYEILKAYARKTKKVIVIGDDDQTIYTWRGSDNDIITRRFMQDFNPNLTQLSINYRCPDKVLNPIIPSIELNKNRFKKGIEAKKSGGSLRVGNYGSYKSMSNALSKGIAADVRDGKSVAILCRENLDGLVPALLLDKSSTNLKYSISGNNMTLDSYVGRQVMGILNLFTSKSGEGVRKAISQLIYSRFETSKIMDEFKVNGTSIWDVDMEDLKYSSLSVYNYVKRWRDYREGHTAMATVQFVLHDYRNNVYGQNNQYHEICRSVIDAVLAVIESYNYDSPSELLADVEDINDRLNARKNLVGSSVQISTIHNFKGKEADSVYVWNDSEGVFPSSKSDAGSLEEERRIHYIACTRALETSTILYQTGKPSPFLAEMDLTEAESFQEKGIGGTLGGGSSAGVNLIKEEKNQYSDSVEGEDDELDWDGFDFKEVKV